MSIVDYDMRDAKPGAGDAPCCPVLRDLYGGDPNKSDARLELTHLRIVLCGHAGS